MLKKLKLGSILAALVLFMFPWLDVQCSEKSMATQTGVQVIYGGGSPSDEMKALGDAPGGDSSSSKSDESMGFAPLVALALIAVLGGVMFSCMALFGGSTRADMLSSLLPAVALGLLILQLMIGFPAKKSMLKAMSESQAQSQSVEDGFDELGSSMAAAMIMNIRIKTAPAFYLELLALGLPTLILINGFIDKYKKGEGGVDGST